MAEKIIKGMVEQKSKGLAEADTVLGTMTAKPQLE